MEYWGFYMACMGYSCTLASSSEAAAARREVSSWTTKFCTCEPFFQCARKCMRV